MSKRKKRLDYIISLGGERGKKEKTPEIDDDFDSSFDFKISQEKDVSQEC